MEYTVALVQGVYFLVTGIWPLISMRTFLAVTGPKTVLWLVKTVIGLANRLEDSSSCTQDRRAFRFALPDDG